jgi:S-adenosylmethionine decarboxylase proenzyme
MDTRGRHVLVEITGAAAERLDDQTLVEKLLVRAAELAGARAVGSAFHRFFPAGVTGVLLLEESHLSIHTWPERGYAAIDFYTCGGADPHVACAHVSQGLGATGMTLLEVERGRLDHADHLRVAGSRSKRA